MEDHSQLGVRRAMVDPEVGGAEGENPGSEAVAAEFGHQLKSIRTGGSNAHVAASNASTGRGSRSGTPARHAH